MLVTATDNLTTEYR